MRFLALFFIFCLSVQLSYQLEKVDDDDLYESYMEEPLCDPDDDMRKTSNIHLTESRHPCIIGSFDTLSGDQADPIFQTSPSQEDSEEPSGLDMETIKRITELAKMQDVEGMSIMSDGLLMLRGFIESSSFLPYRPDGTTCKTELDPKLIRSMKIKAMAKVEHTSKTSVQKQADKFVYLSKGLKRNLAAEMETLESEFWSIIVQFNAEDLSGLKSIISAAEKQVQADSIQFISSIVEEFDRSRRFKRLIGLIDVLEQARESS